MAGCTLLDIAFMLHCRISELDPEFAGHQEDATQPMSSSFDRSQVCLILHCLPGVVTTGTSHGIVITTWQGCVTGTSCWFRINAVYVHNPQKKKGRSLLVC